MGLSDLAGWAKQAEQDPNFNPDAQSPTLRDPNANPYTIAEQQNGPWGMPSQQQRDQWRFADETFRPAPVQLTGDPLIDNRSGYWGAPPPSALAAAGIQPILPGGGPWSAPSGPSWEAAKASEAKAQAASAPRYDSNFYNSSNDTGFYRWLADQRAQQAAPTLQRTSIDFSGYGSGQGGAPVQPTGATYGQNPVAGGDARLQAGIAAGAAAPVTYPENPIVSTPPMDNPSTHDPYASQAPGGSYGGQTFGAGAPQPAGGTDFGQRPGTVMRAGTAPPGVGGVGPIATPMPQVRDPYAVYAPPGAGTAPPTGYGGGAPQPQGNTAFGRVAAGSPSAMGAATQQTQGTANQGPGPAPAPAAPNGGGQFSNPLFQQGQESRQQQGQVMDRTASPDLYANPQQKDAAQSRSAQARVLGAISNPNAYATPDQAVAAQSRGQQQGLMSILNRDVAGGGPSLAEQQLKQGTDANIATANALAASAGPGNAAAASRQAAQTAATAGQQLAGQTAALRAQEYAQARGELGTATTAARGQDLQNLGMDYSNTTNRLGLMSTNAAALRSADLQNQGQSYANTTAQSQLVAQEAQVKRAQDLQATGMSYDMAVKQAQLEADQNKVQFGGEIAQRGLNANQEMGLLGMNQTAQASEQEAKEHAADLLMQKYGIDKKVAVEMVGQSGIANVFKAAAAGGAVGGPWGAAAGVMGGILYNTLS